MKRQKTLANAHTFEKYRRATKREKFLAEMEKVVPWKLLVSLIDPFYPAFPEHYTKESDKPLKVLVFLRIDS